MKIGIICGHGNKDPGAGSNTYGTEANMVRQLAPFIKKYLADYAETILLDTSKNWYEYLQRHSHDFSGFDYVIELHGNAGAHDQGGDGATTGIEIWVTSSEEGITVEQNICQKISEKFGLKNRGVKVTDFLVIRMIKNDGVSCCLIENGFMDDKDDMKMIFGNMEDYCRTMAEAIAGGFGLSKTISEDVITEQGKSSLYYVQCGAFKNKENAENLAKRLRDAGYKSYIKKEKELYKVQAGAYSIKGNAERLAVKLKTDGFDVCITI